MTRFCSCPGCTRSAVYSVTATDAGDSTGETFFTCFRHAQDDDQRRILAETDEADPATVYEDTR